MMQIRTGALKEFIKQDLRLAEEYKTDCARELLAEGFKAWLQSDLFKSRRSKLRLLPRSTQPPVVPD